MLKKKPEGSLVAVAFDDPYAADEARAALLRMAGEELLEIEESAVIVCRGVKDYRVTQDVNIVEDVRHKGHLIGLVIAGLTGVFPFIPVLTIGAHLLGKFSDTGVTNSFIKEVRSKLTPGTSAVLLFLRTDPERRAIITDRLKHFKGTIIASDIPEELVDEVNAQLNPKSQA